jgi:phage terminase large subunit
VSWLCCAYALHGWLFRPGYQVGFGSRKLEYVDVKGDPKSIFEKIRLLLAHLPTWMLPPGWRPEKHSAYCRLLNPATGATITGEGGDNIGRGGRSAVYFVDEAAYLERPQLVDRALSQNTRVRIDVSTPNGPGNPFAEKRFSGRVPVFTFHWRDDPRKGEGWYAEQKRRFDPVTVAQEIDIDYTASVEGITIPAAWVRAAVNLDLPAGAETVAGLDVAEDGKNRNVFLARRGPVVLPPVSWSQCNTTETAHRAREEAVKVGAAVVCYDCVGVGAGVRGTFESCEGKLPFRPHAVNVGAAASEAVWPDGKTSRERFLNLRAELWWLLRCRFEKAYEFREKGVPHPPEDMISIPDHPQLIAELSQPLHRRTETGKIKLEGKDEMRRRGVASPDYGDALALSFARGPRRKLAIFV